MRCSVEMSVWTGKTESAIKEVCAEAALLRAASERLMRRRHNPDVYPHRLVLANPLQFAALEKTQQLGLKRQGHLADLIQKQRARRSPPQSVLSGAVPRR